MKEELLNNLDKIHTTPLGIIRIQKNININVEPVEWCKQRIVDPQAIITRTGKNWYIEINHVIITVNAYSYTIITAHKNK